MRGFTLIEVLTIVGITAIVGAIGALTLPGFRAQNTLDLAAQELKADLRDAQQRSISQDQGRQWGVHIDAPNGANDFYKVFSGSSYAGGTVSKTLYLSPILQFLSPAQGAADDIIFDKVTGNVPVAHSIVIALVADNTVSRSITIPTSGLVTYSSTTPSFDLSLSVNPTSGSVLRGNSINATVSISLLSGVSSSSIFSVSNLPVGASASFSPVSCNPTCSSLMTITTSASTPVGASALPITVTSGSFQKTVNYTLTVLAVVPPGAPTNPSATASSGQVALIWQVPVSDGGASITNYKVYRGAVSGGETFLANAGNFLNYTNTGLTNGTTYYYKVSAENSAGEGVLSNEVSIMTPAQPLSPSNLIATAGIAQVTLNWQAPSSDGGSSIVNYKIYRGAVSGGETLSATIGNILNYSDLSLNNGTAYYYKISAVNGVGESALSSEVSTTTFDVPGMPLNVNAVRSNNQAVINWSPPVSNGGSPITNYKIYRGTISGGETLVVTVGNVLNYTDIGLTNVLNYYYKISAVSAVGEGILSSEFNSSGFRLTFVTSQTYGGSLSASVNTSGASLADTVCQIESRNAGLSNLGVYQSWISDNTSSASSRLIHSNIPYRLKDGTLIANDWNDLTDGTINHYINMTAFGGTLSGFTPVWTGTTQNGSYHDTLNGVYPNVYHSPNCYYLGKDWGLSLYSESGNIGWAQSTNSFWTDYDQAACNQGAYLYCIDNAAVQPTAPNNLNGVPGAAQVSLTWSAPASNGGSPITNYKIYRGTISGGETLVVTVGNVLNYADNVNGGQTYYYKISAVNSVGEGSFSSEISATPTIGVPGMPLNLSAASAGASQIGLTWSVPTLDGGSPITNYKIYRGTISGGETLLTTIGNILNYTDNVAAGNTYYYKVSAINAAGEGALSAEVSGRSAARVFITSTAYTGNLGGLSGADSKCQTRANAASLGGTWKAWLSDGSVSAASRLTHLNIPYVLVDGSLVANNWNDLTDGSLIRPIYKTEYNNNLNWYVWTDTNINGSIYNSYYACSSYGSGAFWNSSASYIYSYIGLSGYNNSSWTIFLPNPYNPQPSGCNNSYSLYCIEQ